MIKENERNHKLYKGVFWVIDDRVISEKKLCDEFGNLIPDENEGIEERRFQDEAWSNNHKKIWSKLSRTVTQGKIFNYFPRGRVEIRRKRAIIFLNPCICYEEMIQKIKAEFRLDNNESIRDISVKADGSRHYRCSCEEDTNG